MIRAIYVIVHAMKARWFMGRERNSLKHGGTRGKVWTRAYNTWHGMLQRCYNPNNPRYEKYGGRGIRVCEEWRHSFIAFLSDMGEPPHGHSLERKDNNGPYSKSNCIWATNTQQSRNKSSNRYLTYNGQSKSLAQWCEELGIPYFTAHARLRRGWSVEETLAKEVRHV